MSLVVEDSLTIRRPLRGRIWGAAASLLYSSFLYTVAKQPGIEFLKVVMGVAIVGGLYPLWPKLTVSPDGVAIRNIRSRRWLWSEVREFVTLNRPNGGKSMVLTDQSGRQHSSWAVWYSPLQGLELHTCYSSKEFDHMAAQVHQLELLYGSGEQKGGPGSS